MTHEQASERIERLDLGDGFSAELSQAPDVAWLPDFFALYDRAFILPDEKEDLAGFRACLALNTDVALQRRYGPFAEKVMIVRDATGAIIAGANFIAFDHASDPPGVTVNLNYVFVDASVRRGGVFRRILTAVEQNAGTSFGAARPVLTFVEINDPLHMDAADYKLDSEHSGLDQLDRLRIWARFGTLLLDFPYQQPALSAGQDADDGLLYGVLGAGGEKLSACRLHDHLDRFFSVSVLKGRPAVDNADAAPQLKSLRIRCAGGEEVGLMRIEPALQRVDTQGAGAASFRDLARGRPAPGDGAHGGSGTG